MLLKYLFSLLNRHSRGKYCIFFGFQKWPYFGSYQSIREEKISELKKQTDLLAEGLKPLPRSYCKPAKPVPAIKDVIGQALPMIGPYKRLDNKQQVVAVIDDVSKYKHTEAAAVSVTTVQLPGTRLFKMCWEVDEISYLY
jgi:hypothetical protein